jgi:ribosomal protein L37AE/L43A
MENLPSASSEEEDKAAVMSCRYCGGTPVLFSEYVEGHDRFWYECPICGHGFKNRAYRLKKNASGIWNATNGGALFRAGRLVSGGDFFPWMF